MTQDPTQTKSKPTTQPLTPPPELPAPPSRQREPLPSWWRWAFLVAGLVVIAGVVLLLTRAPNPASDTRPVEIVKGFADAIVAKDADKMLGFVEPTVYRREIGPEVRAYVEYLQDVRFDNARYELLDNDGQRAHVRWTATMHYTLNLGSETKSGDRPVDTIFELTKFEGNWYLHSAKLPRSQ
jgi:hypothetical protein